MIGKYLKNRRVSRGIEIEDSIMTITQKEKAIMETPFERRTLNLVWLGMFLVMVILAGRLFYLDFFRGDYYSDVSKGNRIRPIVIKAPRGRIMDKFGNVLASNVPSLDAVFIPDGLPDDSAERRRIADEVAEILDMEKGNIETMIESQDRKIFNPVLIKENITQDQALILSEKSRDLPGVEVDETAIRKYENGPIFSFLLGYDGKITQEELRKNPGYLMTDYIGKTGVEKSYEKNLRGMHGAKQVEVDSLGNIKKELGEVSPQSGDDLILNVDEELQKKIYDSLSAMLEETETQTAAAVAIDPRNGGLLAMVSLPSFDNNLFARGISNDEYKQLINDKNLPLFNRVIEGTYPPGSTLKPAVAAAALSEGVITPDTEVDCHGSISIGSFSFGDWKVHGSTDVRKAIAESCDVFFYSVGGGYGNIRGLGMNAMKKYETLFGLGSPTGIDIGGEASGLIPDEEWKQKKIKDRWYIGDSYHSSIGQGFVTATPLQLANYVAAIANKGTLYVPRVVNKIREGEGGEAFVQPKVIRKDFLSEEVLKVVREGMRQTVLSGTAQTLKDLPVEVAGKTGTAQFGTEDKTHAWFVSFAPYDDPKIAMAVLLEGGGEGHSSALPVTREVLDWYFGRNKD